MAHGCRQVLVVDPESWLHTDLIRALRSENIGVLLASTSDLAMQAVQDGFQPDGVLVDFATKDSGTARLLRHVKSAYSAFIIALVPNISVARIGPIPDRQLRKPSHVKELIAHLDDLCRSSTSNGQIELKVSAAEEGHRGQRGERLDAVRAIDFGPRYSC